MGNGFTPGPLVVSDCLDCKDEPGCAIIAEHADVPTGMTPTRGMTAWVGLNGANFDNPDLCRANARLYAAAPVLFEALAEVREWIDNWTPNFVNDDEWPETARKMKAALALASGEASK